MFDSWENVVKGREIVVLNHKIFNFSESNTITVSLLVRFSSSLIFFCFLIKQTGRASLSLVAGKCRKCLEIEVFDLKFFAFIESKASS